MGWYKRVNWKSKVGKKEGGHKKCKQRTNETNRKKL